jgi:hypothetical protein
MLAFIINKIQNNKRFTALVLIGTLLFFGTSVGYLIKKNIKRPISAVAGAFERADVGNKFVKYTSQRYISRGVMVYAEDIVRKESPTLPQSSRFYAYVSSVFYHIYSINRDSTSALYGVKELINKIYPLHQENTNLTMEALSKKILPNDLAGKEGEVLKNVFNWMDNDGYSLPFTEDLKTKPGWEQADPTTLQSPAAGSWKRWLIDENIDFGVLKPYEMSDNLYNAELDQLNLKQKSVSYSQRNTGLFWVDGIGKEGPAGIWQNKLYDEVDLGRVSEEEYAKLQKNLASGLADTTLEVWKVKYLYFLPRLTTGFFQAPMTPSYVSEYAAIGSAGGDILTAMIPNKKEVFARDARDARESGFWTGIRFNRDNQDGFELGKKVAAEVIKKIK